MPTKLSILYKSRKCYAVVVKMDTSDKSYKTTRSPAVQHFQPAHSIWTDHTYVHGSWSSWTVQVQRLIWRAVLPLIVRHAWDVMDEMVRNVDCFILTNTATPHEHGTQHVCGWETTALINTIWILPCFDPNVQAVMATVATLMLLFLPLVMVVYRSQSLTLVYGHFYLRCLVLRNPLTYLVVTSRGSGHRRKIHPLVTLFCEQNCHWVQKCCKKYVPSL